MAEAFIFAPRVFLWPDGKNLPNLLVINVMYFWGTLAQIS
jgi:hypothetical protein